MVLYSQETKPGEHRAQQRAFIYMNILVIYLASQEMRSMLRKWVCRYYRVMHTVCKRYYCPWGSIEPCAGGSMRGDLK